MVVGYPWFLTPLIGCQALAFVTEGYYLGLLTETSSMLIINSLQHFSPTTFAT